MAELEEEIIIIEESDVAGFNDKLQEALPSNENSNNLSIV